MIAARALLSALAAFVLTHAPHAGAAPPSYAQIDWNNRYDPYFVTLDHDDFLIDGGTAFQIWNGRKRTLSAPTGLPRHTFPQREWARMANGTLLAGQAHDADDRPYHTVFWWNPRSRSFSLPLAIPAEADVNHRVDMLTIGANHALVCVSRTEPYDPARNGRYGTLPNQAFLVELHDKRVRRSAPTPQARALLHTAGVQGQVDGFGQLDQAGATAALVYDIGECRWKARVVPAEFVGATYVQIDHRRLPDGRILMLSAFWSDSTINEGRLKHPLLWDDKRAAWTAIAPAPHNDLWPLRYWNYGVNDTPVLAGKGGLSFLNSTTLRWENVALQLATDDAMAVAPLTSGAAIVTRFRQGEIVLGSRDKHARVRPIRLQPSASPAPARLAAAPVDDAARVPLSKAEFDAAVKESTHRYRGETSPAAAWESLDRAKLARMLNMPEFGALPEKSNLIHQAAAWELMYFEKPSDAPAMWQRWFPNGDAIDAPMPAGYSKAPELEIQDANERWGREAGAMFALMKCLPAAAWRVRGQHPMVWNTTVVYNDWLSDSHQRFGPCVRGQDDFGGNPARGAMSAAVLEGKLSAYLLANGCRGDGPDQCLPLLNALVSLNPRHAALPRIVALLAPSFDLEGISLQRTEEDQDENRRRKMRNLAARSSERMWLRLIFLSEQMSMLIARPDTLPLKRIEEVLRESLALELAFNNLEAEKEHRSLQRHPDLYSPWARMASDGVMPPALAQLVARMGRASARVPGCEFSANIRNVRHASARPFWLAFAIEKLGREQTSCQVLPGLSGAAGLYTGAQRERAPINRLRTFLATPGPARDDVVRGLGSGCYGEDPWRICRDKARAR
jgi:hypothetical protein